MGSGGNQRFPRDVRRRGKNGLGARRHGGSGIGWTKGVRGRPNDIATSRAFIPPWSLAVSSRRGEGKTGLLSDQASRGTRRTTGTLAILKMMQIASHLSGIE
ncbi:hypothetical protein BconGalA64_02340 [Burkholderia contaminans]|nr:hypothetical protein BconGalA64_02340 [Burkholderia contaminans]